MFFIQQFLPGLLTAAAICGVVLGILVWLRGRSIGDPWLATIAVGLGYAGGHIVVAGLPSMPPHSATQWLLWFALAGTLAGVLNAFLRPEKFVRGLLWAIICFGLLRLLFRQRFQQGWPVVEGTLWVANLALGTVFLSWFMARIARQAVVAASLPLILTIVAAGTSAALMLSGSLLLGQLASILAAAVGTLFVFTFFMPVALGDGRGAVPVAAVLLSGLWICGYFFAELPAASALLLAFAIVFCGLVPTERMSKTKATLLHASIAIGAVLAAVMIALHASPPFPY